MAKGPTKTRGDSRVRDKRPAATRVKQVRYMFAGRSFSDRTALIRRDRAR